jgi:type II secretory pathway pseudopilin PulG
VSRIRRGSSFIEAVIGMAILGIALLGLAQLFLIGIANNSRAGAISQATFLAQQRVDYLRSLTQAELEAFPSSARGESVDEALDLNADGTSDFRRLTDLQLSGFVWSVKVLVFPASQCGVEDSLLMENPSRHKVLAIMSAIIGR